MKILLKFKLNILEKLISEKENAKKCEGGDFVNLK